MKAYGGMDVEISIFSTSALLGVEWSALRPGCFTTGENAPATHWIGSRLGHRDGLNDVEKSEFLTLPGLELQPLCHPARRQSLYRPSYSGSYKWLALL
jgi:hypothetical protein